MALLLVMVLVIISHTVYLGLLHYNHSQTSRLMNQRAFYEAQIQRILARKTIERLELDDRFQLELQIQQIINEQMGKIQTKLDISDWTQSAPFHYIAFEEEGYFTAVVHLYVHEFWQETPWQILLPTGYVTNRSHQKVVTREEAFDETILSDYQLKHQTQESYFDRLYYRTEQPLMISFDQGIVEAKTDERKGRREILSYVNASNFTSRQFETLSDFYFLIDIDIKWYEKTTEETLEET
ncbi:hypothetical protein [Dolosicoccus paucivorans]|uniref:Uncharacterized protein n=1 Tax=Dolosicoccus paucivorans TaxID=84521 RepID=A0A2N6SQ86_9LACT|nr:hypothetical protein [Dolosicoccus paucivorans]PMB84662.1 hypothetical protein CJ206_02640 [Dolosicoccus paucivorans]PMC59234.1 hypothetical protein CJ205_00575 [Dolosicoccus paucivorans]